jgi:hypothetical protein
MAAGVIIAAVGMGVSMYAQYQEGQDKAQAAARDAANKQLMANETLDRAAANRQSLEIQATEQVGNQSSQFAAGNVAVSSGSPLMVMENTYASARRKIYMDQENANWEAQQDIISGANETTLAGEEQSAGEIGAAGSLLTGAGNMASKYSQNTKNTAPTGGGGNAGNPNNSAGGYDTSTLSGAQGYMYSMQGTGIS